MLSEQEVCLENPVESKEPYVSDGIFLHSPMGHLEALANLHEAAASDR
jgi:hypothetical protein